MAENDAAAEAGRRLHVTVLLVASRRALDNALMELGFPEDDDRIIEHDGRLAFLTCTHETDCDDLFALIAELSARGESWELQSRIDTEVGSRDFPEPGTAPAGRGGGGPVDDEFEQEADEAPALDVETNEGLQALKRVLRRVEPADAFATIRPGQGRPRHRARAAARLAPAAGRGNRFRRGDPARRAA